MEEPTRSAIAKGARRLLPFLILCYAVNFLDRVNVGFAALAMNEDIGLSPSVFGTGAGIFFVGYLLFEIPSNLALQRFGARVWIARIMVSWGIIATAMALVGGETSFYVMRFLLGVAEAGFFPGIILYLTYWFPARERARIVSLFMAAVPLATLVGGPISGALLELHGVGGLKGWHWLFVVEGLPAIALGIAAYFFLDDKPEQARWLSGEERAALSQVLAEEEEATRATGYHALGDALTRPRVLVLALIYFCIVVGLYGIGFWMPQVIQAFGSARSESASSRPSLFLRQHLHGALRHPFRRDRRAHSSCRASASRRRCRLCLVGDDAAARADDDRAHARRDRHLCRHRHVLVGADLDPDRNRRRGGACARQRTRQSRRTCRYGHYRRAQAGERGLHLGAPVPRRRSRARRVHHASLRACGVGRLHRAPDRQISHGKPWNITIILG